MPATRTPLKATLLTPAEQRLLEVMETSPDVSVVSLALGITPKAVRNRTQIIREKLGVSTTTEALAIWKERIAA
jgi:DNA-binding NarL/FixJ family response regulator